MLTRVDAVAETSVTFSARAARDLRKLDPQTSARIVTAIERYAESDVGEVKRITKSGRLRLRVGDWRVFFTRRDDSALELDTILHRREAYR